MLVTEVLFVDEGVVHKLHEGHRDKETPPLLAFPWFGAQFLSHAFLLLESDRRFTHITRFLNVADLVPHIPGQGITKKTIVLLQCTIEYYFSINNIEWIIFFSYYNLVCGEIKNYGK